MMSKIIEGKSRLAIKIAVWVVGILIGVPLLLMCAAAWLLTPERLTPLVEKYASEYLKADLKADRIELTVWRTFPYVALDVSNLRLNSRALDGQPDSVLKALPVDAARLLEARAVHASINPWHLMRKVVKLGDIEIDGLGVNLVAYSPEVANYLIVPPSESDDQPSTWIIEPASVKVKADKGIRYFNTSARVEVNAIRPELSVVASGEELKTSLSAHLNLASGQEAVVSNMPLTLDGVLRWKQSPMAVSTDALQLTVWGVPINVGFGLDLGDQPALTKCDVQVLAIRLLPLARLVAPELFESLPELKYFDTDLALSLQARVKCPWRIDSKELPTVDVTYDIPACTLTYKPGSDADALKISSLSLSGTFVYDGAKPESSRAAIPLLSVKGEGVDLTLDGRVDDALSSDPRITVSSKGMADISRFKALIPVGGSILRGTVDADASISCRLSDLIAMRFNNIDAQGRVEIRNLLFSLPVMATKLYANLSTLTFGNDMETHDYGRGLVRGLLRARVDIDTLYCAVPGIEVGLRDVDLRAGTTPQLLAASSANKEIIPMGMKLNVGRMVADSEVDTMHVNARDLTADGSVTRYEGNSRSPLLKADMSARRLRYTDPLTRLGVRNFSSELTAHLRSRKGGKGKRRTRQKTDSTGSVAMLDMSVQNEGIKALLRRWGVAGAVRADRVNFTYISYPVRTRLTNLALDFTLDSLRLHRAYISSQGNRLSLAGTVSGMRSALLGRKRKPLTVRLDAAIDSLDLNQIAYNYNLGLGLQAKRGVLARINPEDEDALVRAAAEMAAPADAPGDTVPFIVPRNVDALVHLTSQFARYTNLNFYDMHGNLLVNDGALSIDSLAMSTDFGSAYLNMLYSSRDPQLLNMAIDLGFNRVNLKNLYTSFPQLVDMMPVITNLHGMVGASLSGSFNLFPSMDIDMGSLNAMLNITGRDLRVSQNSLIRKIARMMLIRKKGDLDISDMNIQVSVHDNVMRLYPFSFSMEKYKFALLGENDLNQNMYYHLSVLNSPVPWKFGINIKGTFEHPKFRFGGAKYKENEAREVVNLVQTERVNFVKAMRLQLRKLVNRAALDYANRPEPDYGAERRDQSMPDTELTDPTQVISNAIANPIAKALGKNADLLRSLQEKNSKKKKKK